MGGCHKSRKNEMSHDLALIDSSPTKEGGVYIIRYSNIVLFNQNKEFKGYTLETECVKCLRNVEGDS